MEVKTEPMAGDESDGVMDDRDDIHDENMTGTLSYSIIFTLECKTGCHVSDLSSVVGAVKSDSENEGTEIAPMFVDRLVLYYTPLVGWSLFTLAAVAESS